MDFLNNASKITNSTCTSNRSGNLLLLLYRILTSTIHGKIQKSHAKTINLKFSSFHILQYGSLIKILNH